MNSGTDSVEAIEPNARRVRRPGHGQDEDQPDVVGLPHRAHRVVGVLADRARRASARGRRCSCQKPGAEVGAAEHRVEREADQHEARAGLVEASTGSTLARRAGSGQVERRVARAGAGPRPRATATPT